MVPEGEIPHVALQHLADADGCGVRFLVTLAVRALADLDVVLADFEIGALSALAVATRRQDSFTARIVPSGSINATWAGNAFRIADCVSAARRCASSPA